MFIILCSFIAAALSRPYAYTIHEWSMVFTAPPGIDFGAPKVKGDPHFSIYAELTCSTYHVHMQSITQPADCPLCTVTIGSFGFGSWRCSSYGLFIRGYVRYIQQYSIMEYMDQKGSKMNTEPWPYKIRCIL